MADNFERLGFKYNTLISVHAPNPDRPITKADFYATMPGSPGAVSVSTGQVGPVHLTSNRAPGVPLGTSGVPLL